MVFRFYVVTFMSLILSFSCFSIENKKILLLKKRIQNEFNEENSEVILALKNDEILPEISEALSDVYFELAELYEKEVNSSPENLNKVLIEFEKYIKICEELDIKIDKIDKLVASVNQYKKAQKEKRFQIKGFLKLSYLSWQDSVILKRSNKTINLISSTEGSCLGGGVKYESIKWSSFIDSCMFFGTANLGENDSSIDYFDRGVDIFGIYTRAGGMFYPLNNKGSINFGFSTLYRKGDYTSTGDYLIEDDTTFINGMFLGLGLGINKFKLGINYTKLFSNYSNLWTFDLSYNF